MRNKILGCCITVGFLLILQSPANAQYNGTQIYTVSFLPRKAHYDPDTLTKELSRASTREQARKIIISKQFIACKLILLEHKPGRPLVWWFINTGDNTESFKDFTVLRSKGLSTLMVTRLGDFREIIHDTLLLLDTLRLEVHLQEPGYRDADFILEFACDTQPEASSSSIAGRTTLSLYPGMVKCSTAYTKFVLRNKYNPGRKLTTAMLTVLDPEKEAVARTLVLDYRKANPTLQNDILEEFAENVMIVLYGTPPRGSVHQWLVRNGILKP